MKNRLISFLLLLNLFGLAFLLFTSVLNDSPTSDEPPHLLSGYDALKYGNDYIDSEHPLLAKVIAASPLLALDVKQDLNDPNFTTQKNLLDVGKMFNASRDWLVYEENSPDQIMFWGRIPMMALTIFFALVLFFFTKSLFGQIAALIAVFLYSTEPNILANGNLINTDIAGAGFIFTSIFALYLYSQRQNSERLLFLIVALTSALLSKFSTVYLLPVILVLMEIIFRLNKTPKRVHILYVAVVPFLLICLFYGVISFRTEGFMGFIPTTWFWGLSAIFGQVSLAGRFTYLLGESYHGSRPYYFPVLIATKTQMLTLLGFSFSLFFIWKKQISLSKKTLLIIFVPFLIFLASSLISKLNIGVRHVMPLYPFLIMFSAAGLVTLWKVLVKNTKIFSSKYLLISGIFLTILLGSRLWSVTTTYPHFLSYYNILAGGTDNGWKVANDSNYDWGQDVKRLANYVKENNIPTIGFDNYSGLYAADYYGMPYTKLTPKDKDFKGYAAISTSALTFHEDKEENYSWITDHYQPIARAGKSIFIYKIE